MFELWLENKNLAGLVPLHCGREQCEPSHAYGPEVRRHYLLHYVVRGKGSFSARGSVYPVRAGEAFLIRPGEVTRYQADAEDPWEYIWIGFTGQLAARYRDLPAILHPNSGIMLDIAQAHRMHEMQEEFLTGQLFLLTASLTEKQATADHVAKARNYLDFNYMTHIRLDSLAGMLGLDRRYLARIFKQKTGQTMQQYLISRRMKEAARLLCQGYPVGLAGHMVGYDDAFAFSRAFHRHFSCPPREYAAQQEGT